MRLIWLIVGGHERIADEGRGRDGVIEWHTCVMTKLKLVGADMHDRRFGHLDTGVTQRQPDLSKVVVKSPIDLARSELGRGGK